MIVARELTKRHGTESVLRGVSLEVAKGEKAVIMGLSGCGKSTFLRCLNGLERFQGGSVTVGEDLRLDAEMADSERDRILKSIRKRVGMVFQAYHLFPHMSVLQNVIEAPMRVLGRSRDQAEHEAREWLDRVRMLDFQHKKPAALSGGQQQRVAIARALAMRPEAILFDEPTSALDPTLTAEVQGLLSGLARDGLTMIIVTHSLGLARQIADTVHIFHAGQVAESGPPSNLFESPIHEATRSLLKDARAA